MLTRKKQRHKLVALGDSLTQGFNNGCIYRTDINYPAMLAGCLGDNVVFDQPVFSAQGGIPLNLEILIRGLSDLYGDSISVGEYLSAAKYIYTTTQRVRKYWQNGYEKQIKTRNTPYHNQSIWGLAANDAWLLTEKICRDYMLEHPPKFTMFDFLHSNAKYTTSRLVLNPGFKETRENCSMLDNIFYFSDNGGIENLIVYLGGNNIVGAITEMELVYSDDDEINELPFNRPYTVTRPEHFERMFRYLAEQISRLNVKNIITATIPYITIPPVTRGVNKNRSNGQIGYYDYYTRFWIWDDDFNPEIHPHLTREEAIQLDIHIDEYNRVIKSVANEYGWIVVPLNRYISNIAARRLPSGKQITFPHSFVRALKNNPDTSYLVTGENTTSLTSHYLQLDRDTGHIRKGGIFSLDGLHPTTIGYGLIANTFYQCMKRNGISFEKELDWDSIIASDTLVSQPPYILIELRQLLHFLSMGPKAQWSKISSNLFQQVTKLFSSGEEVAKSGKKTTKAGNKE